MNDKQNEPKLTYALDESGKMVYILDVPRGKRCNCCCPKCKEPLVAKLGHEGGRQPHFAHQKDADCHGSYMTALHLLAQQIIEKEKQVMLPDYNGVYYQKETTLVTFDDVKLEETISNDNKILRADCIGFKSGNNTGGHRLLIEILVTHEVDEQKRNYLKSLNEYCIEIDLSDLLEEGYTDESVTKRLLESKFDRKWISCPLYDNKDIRIQQELEEQCRKEEEERVKLQEMVDKWYSGKESNLTTFFLDEIQKRPYVHKKNGLNGPNPLFNHLVHNGDFLYFTKKSPKTSESLLLFYNLLRFYHYNIASTYYKELKDALGMLQRKTGDLTPEETIILEELISLKIIYILTKRKSHFSYSDEISKTYKKAISEFIKDDELRSQILVASSIVYHHIVGTNVKTFDVLIDEAIQQYPSMAKCYLSIVESQNKFPQYSVIKDKTKNRLSLFVDNHSFEEDESLAEFILKECYSFAFNSDNYISYPDMSNSSVSYGYNGYENGFSDDYSSQRMADWDIWYDSLGRK